MSHQGFLASNGKPWHARCETALRHDSSRKQKDQCFHTNIPRASYALPSLRLHTCMSCMYLLNLVFFFLLSLAFPTLPTRSEWRDPLYRNPISDSMHCGTLIAVGSTVCDPECQSIPDEPALPEKDRRKTLGKVCMVCKSEIHIECTYQSFKWSFTGELQSFMPPGSTWITSHLVTKCYKTI